MNCVLVRGGTKRQRDLVASMAEFCIEKLMPRMQTLDIEISLETLDGDYGYCMSNTNRDFFIEVDKTLDLRTLLETVAHEMVHVKQYARGELFENIKLQKHRWQGLYLNKDPEYWDRPWEIEAHGRETGLFVRFCEQRGHALKKWAHVG